MYIHTYYICRHVYTYNALFTWCDMKFGVLCLFRCNATRFLYTDRFYYWRVCRISFKQIIWSLHLLQRSFASFCSQHPTGLRKYASDELNDGRISRHTHTRHVCRDTSRYVHIANVNKSRRYVISLAQCNLHFYCTCRQGCSCSF